MLVVRESADGYFAQIAADAPNGKVHLRQLHCCACGFLTVNSDLFRVSVMTLHELHRLHEHTAGTAARIINCALERLYHFGNQIDNAFRSIELSLAFAFLQSKIGKEVFIHPTHYILLFVFRQLDFIQLVQKRRKL